MLLTHRNSPYRNADIDDMIGDAICWHESFTAQAIIAKFKADIRAAQLADCDDFGPIYERYTDALDELREDAFWDARRVDGNFDIDEMLEVETVLDRAADEVTQ